MTHLKLEDAWVIRTPLMNWWKPDGEITHKLIEAGLYTKEHAFKVRSKTVDGEDYPIQLVEVLESFEPGTVADLLRKSKETTA